MSVATQAVTDSSEIRFEEGIIGVPRARRFHLLERSDSPIRFLRCLDIEGFNLPVVDPYLVDPSYQANIDPRMTVALGMADGDPILLLAITTLDPKEPTANLRAPLVINAARRLGIQVILDGTSYPLSAPLPSGEKVEMMGG